MKVAVDFKRMTIAEKLDLMEAVWEDLRETEVRVASPEWHGEVLRERAERVERGEEKPIDWEEAKKRLQNELL